MNKEHMIATNLYDYYEYATDAIVIFDDEWEENKENALKLITLSNDYILGHYTSDDDYNPSHYWITKRDNI